jgi:hypothetical protein
MKPQSAEERRVANRNAVRYRLHRKVKDAGFRMAVKKKTIYSPENSSILANKHLWRLIKEFRYALQFEIS